MQPIAFELILLRSVLPELVIRPGMALAARVAERQGRHGIITIAGNPLVAELPEGVERGENLRLRVEDVTGDRVLMRLADQPSSQASSAVPGLPLPDGRTAHLRVEDEDMAWLGEDFEEGSVALTYESASLGPISFQLGLGRGTVTATVRVRDGEPLLVAERAAEELRSALARSTGRAAQVHVSVRRDPVDVYV
jgi:hypothetical protein